MGTVQADSCLNYKQIDTLFISLGGQEGGFGRWVVILGQRPNNWTWLPGFLNRLLFNATPFLNRRSRMVILVPFLCQKNRLEPHGWAIYATFHAVSLETTYNEFTHTYAHKYTHFTATFKRAQIAEREIYQHTLYQKFELLNLGRTTNNMLVFGLKRIRPHMSAASLMWALDWRDLGSGNPSWLITWSRPFKVLKVASCDPNSKNNGGWCPERAAAGFGICGSELYRR
jgi:hypothetical protein